MIIEALLSAVLSVLQNLFAPFSIVTLPLTLETVLATFVSAVLDGCAVVACYTHWQYLLILLNIVIIVDAVCLAYNVLMWCLTKIPFLNIHR